MIELVVRMRCEECGDAYEGVTLATQFPAQFPVEVTLPVAGLPQGWTRDGDRIFCPQHKANQIEVVPALPDFGRRH